MLMGQAKEFQDQSEELNKLLSYRERVVEYLSKNETLTDSLYEQAAQALNEKTISTQAFEKRERILNDLNLHILQICYDDSDKKVVHFRYISRVLPDFFELLNQDQRESVRELHITGDSIPSLPDNISNLTKLEILYLNKNNLKALPPSLGDITPLHSLNVAENKISKIDEKILMKANLHRLDVSSNPIDELEIKRMASLCQHRHIEFINDSTSSKMRY